MSRITALDSLQDTAAALLDPGLRARLVEVLATRAHNACVFLDEARTRDLLMPILLEAYGERPAPALVELGGAQSHHEIARRFAAAYDEAWPDELLACVAREWADPGATWASLAALRLLLDSTDEPHDDAIRAMAFNLFDVPRAVAERGDRICVCISSFTQIERVDVRLEGVLRARTEHQRDVDYVFCDEDERRLIAAFAHYERAYYSQAGTIVL